MSDLAKASEAELKAYEESILAKQGQGFPASINQIKVWYDKENNPEWVGKYVQIKSGETDWTLLGDSFEGVILTKRNQYVYYAEDKTESMFTEQFQEFNQPVKVMIGGEETTVQPIAPWIKENYPKGSANEATYINMLYILKGEEVFLFKAKGCHMPNWIDFSKALDPRSTLFSFNTKFGLTTGKKGSVTYYPATYAVGKSIEGDAYRNILAKSFEFEGMLDGTGVDDMVKEAEAIFEVKKN